MRSGSEAAHRVAWTSGLALSAVLAATATHAAPPKRGPAQPPRFEYEGPPRDPDDTPFMRPPNNQLGQWSSDDDRPVTPKWSNDRRFQLTVMPVFAALRIGFIGRPAVPVRGFGAALDADLRLLRFLWVRAHFGHSLHPVHEETATDDESGEVEVVANRGFVSVTNFGGSLVYPLDLGRFLPFVDLGVGGMVIRGPDPARRGQMGAECRDDGTCDPGLACQADNVCHVTVLPELHVGLGLEILIRHHFTLGGYVRYFAFLTDVASFPVYLIGAVRFGARF